ncbi:gamma-glutamylcyclotransferase [Ketobacter sp. MCCC 1A13808]|uniref:gamma-glutamylcyclotransferase family protein n=1 Tax=Ketobacter sp. MCCC 1A13808 TaxID=2602738 RepID=UPI0012EC6829|nr:gamma-glutamylcyclotransferase family protein [Ketobacter sp. MCCC 1A13808]MVF13616.1 gamma-glutamylcyclotransferase [Ketobacter sp. MCCC 1A13808]
MTEETLHYFAYGSNLSVKRLQKRVPGATPLGVYFLPEHQLLFHKQGKDGSAKCDAAHTGNPTDLVYGVLYTIPRREKPFLDLAEGLGVGYQSRDVTIFDADQQPQTAMTYYAILINRRMAPYSWYKSHVLTGAREAGRPAEYIEKIQQIEAVEDQDYEREMLERSIYLPV